MNQLLNTLKQRWTQYLLEAIAIILGILGAFGLDNWKETRNQRQTEQLLLESLKTEMVENQERLSVAMSYHSKSRTAAYKVLEFFNGDHPGEDHQKLDSLLALTQWAWTYNPSMGALNSIKLSGQLNSVQNAELRTMITNYEDLTTDAQEENKIIQDLIIEKFIPAVNKYIPLSQRVKYLGEDYVVGQSAFSADYKGLFQDRMIEGIISYIYIWRIDEQSEEEQLKEVMEEFIFILDKEIDK